jgi:methyl-accepting chemotaxis protein
MNILRRISVSYAVLIALTVVVAVICFATLSYVTSRLESERAKQVQLMTLTEQVKAGFYKEIDSARLILLERAFDSPTHTDPELVAKQTDSIESALKEILPAGPPAQEYKVFESSSTAFDAAHARVVALANQGKFRQAADAASQELAPAGSRVDAALTSLGSVIDRKMAADVKSLSDLRRTAGIAIGGVAAVVVLIGIVMAILQRRAIGKSLGGVISRLSSSTAEMLAVVSQVAAGAVQTATAISEAATTVDEVRQTSLLSSQKATAVADTAQQAEGVAGEGVQVVTDAIDNLKAIGAQMGEAAECVVRLSEQTEAVSEIISTSNDIAEQSNLLSVNASIEAAKATDAGKGFAVVADEIKNLAQQSKQAVMQVRTILLDIQKATSAAVMAAERSCKMVEDHTANAVHSHKTIQTLGDGVVAASQAAAQIVASSQQQLVGMDQISEAMASIDQASAQNAAGARQMEAEVRHLNDLSLSLRAMIDSSVRKEAGEASFGPGAEPAPA